MNITATALCAESLRNHAPRARHHGSPAGPNDMVCHREEEDVPIPSRPPGLGGRRTLSAPTGGSATPGSVDKAPSRIVAGSGSEVASSRVALSEAGSSQGYHIVIADPRVRTHLE